MASPRRRTPTPRWPRSTATPSATPTARSCGRCSSAPGSARTRSKPMPGSNGDQVLILGGSIAGLLAARVLSERFERVVVIERDVLPPAGEHRRGVPHGRHLHGLHPRGREILEELFPGFTASLTASGAVSGDILG